MHAKNHTIKDLMTLLADTYGLYLKTKAYHWNIIGGHFYFLHQALEEQYTNLAEAIDNIAERIRILGEKVPASFKLFSELTTLKDADETLAYKDMLLDLRHDHASLLAHLRTTLARIEHDEGTSALLSDQIVWHEKQVWMLDSTLRYQAQS